MPSFADNWMQTFTGRRIGYDTVSSLDIDIADIAQGLAHANRFAGQTRWPYSVAQHSVLVARNVPAEHKLAALLHDAAEAYLGDVPRPLKRLLPEYVKIEKRFERAIADRFGLPYPIKNAVIDEIDTRILLDERDALMPSSGHRWLVDDLQPVGVVVERWSAVAARNVFLADFEDYLALNKDLVLRGVS